MYTAVDVPLISVENAMPIRDDLQEAMSYVIARSVAANEYGQLSQMQRNTRGIVDRDGCVGFAQSEGNSESKLDAATMMAPFLICFLFTTGGLIMRWGLDMIAFSAKAGAAFGMGFVILFVLGFAATAARELSLGEELGDVVVELIGNAFFLGLLGGVIGLIAQVKKLAEAKLADAADPTDPNELKNWDSVDNPAIEEGGDEED